MEVIQEHNFCKVEQNERTKWNNIKELSSERDPEYCSLQNDLFFVSKWPHVYSGRVERDLGLLQ